MSTTTIVESENFLLAFETDDGHAVVYRSPIVSTRRRLYAPVAEFLARRNARLIRHETVRDDMMMGYRAEVDVYDLDA